MAKGPILVDTKQLDRLIIELKGFEKEMGEAVYHTLNRTIDQVITQTGRIVPKSYAIKNKEVKQSFARGIKRPTKNNLKASITSKGHTLSLAHFPHSPKTRLKKRYKVKATIKREGGRKTINTQPLPFIASTGAKSSDKVQHNIFKRIGTSRLPIKLIRTLSIPQMITNEKVASQIQRAAQERYEDRLEHEVIYRMTNINNRVKRG